MGTPAASTSTRCTTTLGNAQTGRKYWECKGRSVRQGSRVQDARSASQTVWTPVRGPTTLGIIDEFILGLVLFAVAVALARPVM